MGGGDLNMKKSWHPQTMRNIERVWKKEETHAAEKKKIEELQKELEEERAREDMQRFAVDHGTVEKKSDKLDWMYQGAGNQVNREDYLLGKSVDKSIMDANNEHVVAEEDDQSVGAIFDNSSVNLTIDMANKVREDPLFAIKKREEQSKKDLLNNPVKMKQLQEMLRHNLGKKDKKKKKKKEKKHKRSHRESSSDEEEEDRKHKHRKRKSSSSEDKGSPEKRRKPDGYGLLRRASPDESLSHKLGSRRSDQSRERQDNRKHNHHSEQRIDKHDDRHTDRHNDRHTDKHNDRHTDKHNDRHTDRHDRYVDRQRDVRSEWHKDSRRHRSRDHHDFRRSNGQQWSSESPERRKKGRESTSPQRSRNRTRSPVERKQTRSHSRKSRSRSPAHQKRPVHSKK
nr:PREDICTED: pre-mRNA-splicing factor CWC25 homolog isoform X2 [Saccoglossus kowalevskii]